MVKEEKNFDQYDCTVKSSGVLVTWSLDLGGNEAH